MIARTFYTLFFSIAISDILIYITHIHKLNYPIVKILWFVPSILLIIGLICIMYGSRQSYMIDKAHIGSYYFMLCLALTIPKCVFALVYMTKYIFQNFTQSNINNIFTNIALIAGGLFFIVIVYGTLFGWKKAKVNEVKIESNRLPASFNGFKIVHISDIHASTWMSSPKSLNKIIEKINSLNPDVIMFTGDLITHKTSELKDLKEILNKLHAKYGVYSVLGNHDYSPYYPWKNIMDKKRNFDELIKTENELGWHLLNNRHDYIKINSDSIAIIGVENWGEPPFSKYGNLPKAMEGVDDSCFKILLSHNPSHWKSEVISTDIDLTLSGHTHAMQLKIFGLSPSEIKYKEWSGLYKHENKYLYVNEGLGCTLIPFRFGSWPEITLISLIKG